ncbi:HalOD1 output domain-containing protein [Natrarchaeobius chitinivorans]|uniref:HalOD1 output domain-containing protein n=1 Tax=Natrarchaeobius chitinivorans TaxID=1679083 RepID=UPI001FB53A86|nr:HalOD1 output domain-containing protein [Natrarchaeobius chitinivorans]
MIDQTYDDVTPASIAIIKAICAVENVDPVDAPDDLGFTLHDHVDPEALDTMVTNGTGDVSVELRLEDYHVLVEDTGRIRVRLASDG